MPFLGFILVYINNEFAYSIINSHCNLIPSFLLDKIIRRISLVISTWWISKGKGHICTRVHSCTKYWISVSWIRISKIICYSDNRHPRGIEAFEVNRERKSKSRIYFIWKMLQLKTINIKVIIIILIIGSFRVSNKFNEISSRNALISDSSSGCWASTNTCVWGHSLIDKFSRIT